DDTDPYQPQQTGGAAEPDGIQTNHLISDECATGGEVRRNGTGWECTAIDGGVTEPGRISGGGDQPYGFGTEAGAANVELPVLEIEAARMPNIAENVQSALDEGHPRILARTTDESLIRGNRAAACEGFCGPGSPDEYPFASTRQGGAGARVAGVPIGEQRIQGGVLSRFYRKYSIGEGDLFRVIVRGLE
ncbi:NucA/NucB deoxyribonuclease domain-containing protein, partial [Prauserella alba]